jgi:hypothetical protein
VTVAVPVRGVDRGDLDAAGELQRIIGDLDGALEAVERAADGGDAQVLDLEADVRVGGVDRVGAGRDAGEGRAPRGGS